MAERLNTAEIKQKVFDFEKSTEWKYAGERPCIIDFYADWCGPCKMVAPILEQVSKDYSGKLEVYKVNTDEEPDVAQAFGIQSIPSILFVPMEGQPRMSVGAQPRKEIDRMIGEVLAIPAPVKGA
jgi:thioredoxin 1